MKITYALILLLLFGFTSYAQNDCPEAIIVCGDANYYDLEAIGIGDFPEINFNNACSSGENNSIWLKIQINQGGTLGFILTPEEDDLIIDFDFWLFGPIQDCNDIGTAIRCSTTNPIQAGLDYITTGMNETETDISEGPGPDGNAFVNWITVQDNEFYFLVVDRPHGFGNFSMEWTGTATFHTVPVFLNPDGIPLDMQQCDKDGVNDNTATFDLTIYNDMFIGSQSPMEITYHDDLDGATTNTNQITSPEAYQNVSNPQTVYLRMTNTVTGCYSIQTFNIEATYPITTGIPEDLNLCDSNKNGINTFDLSLNDTNVKGVNPSSSIVTYYTSEEDALSGSNPVGPMFDNQTPYTAQTIWPRLEDADGCFNYDFNTFTINIIPSPIINNPDNISFDQDKCDLDDVNDNSTPFDLTLHAEVMKGDQDTVEITYYDNEDDAETGTNFITHPTNYYNITNPQTIYTRLTDGITGCYTIGTFEINILPTPTINPHSALAECDFNNDGFTQFNLIPVLQQIENDLGNVTVTIHETPEDAFFNVNSIPNTDNYTNIDQNNQTLYIRAESIIGCFDIAELQLIVNPVPEAITPLPYALCDDGINDSDGQAIFDLTSRAVEILGSLDPAQYSLTYHLNANDAALGTPGILNPVNYLSNSKIVYVRVTNNATGCYDIVPLELIVNSLPVLITNQLTYTLCDITAPANNEKEIFDLTSKIPEFIADQGSVTTTFHTTFNDAQDNINMIDEPWAYQNQEQGVETIFVRFTFDDTSCYRIGFLDIRVAPLPIILEPTQDDLTVCDTNGQGIGEFDLSALIPDMMNNEPNLEISFHETADDAQNGVNAIPNPDNYTNASPYLQFIYVRVVESQYKCFNTFMLTLMVAPAPQAPSLEDLTFCDDADNNGQDGKRRVDLTVQNAVIADALGLTIPDDLIVEYYTTETGANSGLANRITNPATYMGSDQQVIWVRVEDPVTGCYSVESFMLIFNAPHALTTPSPLAICNEALPNDGQAEFDLTVREDQLLGPSGIGQG
ncbi:hypothetical protein NHE85_10795, partial [Flavobacterium sp. NRK1]|nr:hypothetical protein [Flavobacterium sp. NRK1]